ncbi:ECSIT protein, partial [Ceuthmochares aereus]|nr:ECSIT protein [Ceuthmochares aereus]
EPLDPERSLYYPLQLDLDLERGPWDDDEFDVDEGKARGGSAGGGGKPLCAPPSLVSPPLAVEEGPVFALCMAGAGDRRTLGKWIAGLQATNPVLGCTPVLFRLADGDPAPP